MSFTTLGWAKASTSELRVLVIEAKDRASRLKKRSPLIAYLKALKAE